MKNFDYAVAGRLEDAFISDGTAIMPIAGGTELLNWIRLGISAPNRVIDLGRIEGLDEIGRDGDRLSIGALATLNAIGEDALVAEHATALADACLKAASAQIRNRATIGGNVLQKTRCAYFRAEEPLPWGCNKRAPGSGCAARDGLNDRHAILGWTDDCVAVQPSDPVVALAAPAPLFAGSAVRRRPDMPNTDSFDLEHFVTAQAPVFASALDELKAGQKHSHWMWFVFPQLRGLGHSAIAQRDGEKRQRAVAVSSVTWAKAPSAATQRIAAAKAAQRMCDMGCSECEHGVPAAAGVG